MDFTTQTADAGGLSTKAQIQTIDDMKAAITKQAKSAAGAITTTVDQVKFGVDALAEVRSKLEKALNAVLKPNTAMPGGDGTKDAFAGPISMSPVATALATEADRLSAEVNALRRLLNALDL